MKINQIVIAYKAHSYGREVFGCLTFNSMAQVQRWLKEKRGWWTDWRIAN